MSELMNKCVGEWTDGWLDDWMHGWLNVCVGCLLVVDPVADLAIGLEGRTAPPRPSWL